MESDTYSMDSYIEQTNLKLRTNIVNDVKKELDKLESNIGKELDKLSSQKCTCECSGMEPPTEYVTFPSSPSTQPPTEPPTEPPSPCEGTGWKRVAYLNMTDPGASCPHAWKLHTFDDKRVCGRLNSAPESCDSTTFSVDMEEYSQVCGRIKAYMFERAIGFKNYYVGFHGPPVTIDGRYADGVSLTHGSPQQHIWTFAAQTLEGEGFCPCDTIERVEVPWFVGKDYFCEAGQNGPDYHPHLGFVSTNPLWDGKDCTESPCCSFNNPPYFLKTLQAPTTDYIEARICLYDPPDLADIMVEEIELYIR